MKTVDELDAESIAYANDRYAVEEMSRVDEVAMAYRDGYRIALSDLQKQIVDLACGDHRRGTKRTSGA